MIQQAIDMFWQQVESNNFLSGGLMLGLIGAIGMRLRQAPSRAYQWCKRRAFLVFEIQQKDDAYRWFEQWLSNQHYSVRKAKHLTVRTMCSARGGVSVNGVTLEPRSLSFILAPAPGIHWLWWEKKLVIVNRERKELPPGPGEMFGSEREVFTVSILTRDRSCIIRLLEEANRLAEPPEDNRVRVFTNQHGDWHCSIRRAPRPLESVILRHGVAEAIVADIERFQGDAERYAKLGVPYRRGYGLPGPPGSGKSSLIFAIASHLKMNVAVLSLNDAYMNDSFLRRLLANVPDRCLVAIEDVDCIFTDRDEKKDKENTVTFSGLLNAIDGICASEGNILFMTSNCWEDLDPALVRPGRVDYQVHIGEPDWDQCRRLFERFYDQDGTEFANVAMRQPELSMAKLQGILVAHRDDPEAAVEAFDQLHLCA